MEMERILSLKDDKCIFTPSDFIKYLSKERKVTLDKIRVPPHLLITYHRSSYECAKQLINGNLVDWWIYDDVLPLCIGKYQDAEIAVGRIWVGAPGAVMTLEELIACGAKTIFEVGMCGGLQTFLQPGDIVVVTEAIRDEGTSFHYLPSREDVKSSECLRYNLVSNLNRERIHHHVGRVWSTDGVYRETCEKFLKFRNAGVLGVDMETSAIFAVAQYRGVKAASAQIVSDILTESEWQTRFRHQSVRENTEVLVKIVLETLSQC
jgi:uridine phosphorylase